MKIGYARVSTLEQNLDMQKDALKKAGCEMIFEEKVSTRKANRPERERMMNILRPGDTIVIWKLDRYARSTIELTNLVKILEEKQVDILSLNDPIDTSNATGRLLFNIMASLAEFERDIIRERTKAGLAAARARGRTGGRPKGLSKEAKAIAKMAASLYKANDLSVNEISQSLKISKGTLYKYLRIMKVKVGTYKSSRKLLNKQ